MCAALTDVRSMCDRLRRDETKVRYGRRCLWRCRASRDVPDARDGSRRRGGSRARARRRYARFPAASRSREALLSLFGLTFVFLLIIVFAFWGFSDDNVPLFPPRVARYRYSVRDTRRDLYQSRITSSCSYTYLGYLYTRRDWTRRVAFREPERGAGAGVHFLTDLARRRSARTPSYTRAGISSAVRPMPRHRSH